MTISLAGIWRATVDGVAGDIRIPGTLDESGIGHRDAGATGEEAAAAGRLTRRLAYEGEARALLNAIYIYLDSEDFKPAQSLQPDALRQLFEA